MPRYLLRRAMHFVHVLPLVTVLLLPSQTGRTQSNMSPTSAEKPIVEQLRGLRALPDEQRTTTTRQLAVQIRTLPSGEHKVVLANALASLSTEGDFGRDTLQEVTTTLEEALKEHPAMGSEPAAPYMELAELVRYEHMTASLDDPRFAAAVSALEAADLKREHADFTLEDLSGKKWRLSDLRGKVVLVNFWATWCPPCRKEIPSLEKLYRRFKDRGLVILAISDEDAGKVSPIVATINASFPVLLDPGRKVNELFQVEGIPKTFIYDREGKLVSQSIDMRTEKQFLAMLGAAGVQ